jgi:hypothetical protein
MASASKPNNSAANRRSITPTVAARVQVHWDTAYCPNNSGWIALANRSSASTLRGEGERSA